MTDLTRQIIDFSARDEGAEAREAFYAALHDKVTAHINSHKEEIAKTLIQPEQEPEVAQAPAGTSTDDTAPASTTPAE